MTVNLVCPKCGNSIGLLCGGTTSRERFIELCNGYMTCKCGAFMQKTGPLYGPADKINERKESVMGYYASGSGDIVFARTLTESEAKDVEDILKYWFNDVWWNSNDTGKRVISATYDDKYREDCFEDLKRITAPIKEGTFYFTGEDGENWKFVYSDENGWQDIGSRIVYADEPFIRQYDSAEFVGQIIDIFEDFLEDKGIDIPNEDKDQSENPAIIYGMDYGKLQSEIESMMYHWGVLREDK